MKLFALKLDFGRLKHLVEANASIWLKALQSVAIDGGLQSIQEIELAGANLEASPLDIEEVLSFVKNQSTLRVFHV